MDFINSLSIELKTFILAMLPVVELRGAIPLGIFGGLSPMMSMLLSLFGSMLPVPFILIFIKPVTDWLRNTKLFKNLVEKLEARTMKNEETIKKYGLFGLVILVAIPLPGTGVWTGTFLASLMGIKFKDALPAVFLGDLIAGIIVLIISVGAHNIF